MTTPFPDGGHGAHRALHRDRAGREGIEAELVSRLTTDVSPEGARRVLVRYLDGALSTRGALALLLVTCGSVTALRELVDDITARADEDSRAGDSLVRDRADALTRLFVESEAACARATARMREGEPAVPFPSDGPADDEAAYADRLYDRLLGR